MKAAGVISEDPVAEGEFSPEITDKKGTENIAASVIQSYFCKFLDRLADKKQ